MAAVVGVFGGLGLAVAGLINLLWPGHVHLATAVAQADAARDATGDPPPVRSSGGWLGGQQARLGSWLIAAVGARRLRIGARPADLTLLARSPELWMARRALTTLYGGLAPVAAAAAFLPVVRLPAVPLVLSSLAGAGAAWQLTAAELRRAATVRRRDLVRATGCYLDLVGMSLAGGRAVTEALPSCAAIGTGWTFSLFAETVTGARLAGETPWQALGVLGERIGVAELRDLASALTLVADDGARVRDSITARAATVRRRQLAETEGRAGRADQGMFVVQIVLAFGFLLLVLYPAAYQVLSF